MDPIVAYLNDGVVLVDKKEVRNIMYQAINYTLVDKVLYKRGLNPPYSDACNLKRVKRFYTSYTPESATTTSRTKCSMCVLSGSAIIGQH